MSNNPKEAIAYLTCGLVKPFLTREQAEDQNKWYLWGIAGNPFFLDCLQVYFEHHPGRIVIRSHKLPTKDKYHPKSIAFCIKPDFNRNDIFEVVEYTSLGNGLTEVTNVTPHTDHCQEFAQKLAEVYERIPYLDMIRVDFNLAKENILYSLAFSFENDLDQLAKDAWLQLQKSRTQAQRDPHLIINS